LSPLDLLARAFEPDLFNSEAYAQLHARRFDGKGVRCEYFQNGHTALGGAFHAMQISPGIFASPGRGPYGGFDTSSDISDADLEDFVIQTEFKLKAAGATRIEIVMPPFCYAPQRGPQNLALLCRLGYRVIRQELNQALTVGEVNFADQGDYANRKRLKKAARAGVVVRELATAEHKDGYNAILESRQKKSRSLSMTWEDVEAMQAAFPGRVRLFGAEHDRSILAAAICLAVNRRVFYVYAWGERAGAEPISPVSSIAAHLFEYAQHHGFALLDLGTSSLDGIINPGLHRFKRSLGATTSLKLWLQKCLA
jgi:hypothetical protein